MLSLLSAGRIHQGRKRGLDFAVVKPANKVDGAQCLGCNRYDDIIHLQMYTANPCTAPLALS